MPAEGPAPLRRVQSLGHWLPREDGREVVKLHPSALLRVDSEGREAAFEAFVADLRQAKRLFRR